MPATAARRTLTGPMRELLAAVAAGQDVPADSHAKQRLATLKRLGYLARERPADGDAWTVVAEAEPGQGEPPTPPGQGEPPTPPGEPASPGEPPAPAEPEPPAAPAVPPTPAG